MVSVHHNYNYEIISMMHNIQTLKRKSSRGLPILIVFNKYVHNSFVIMGKLFLQDYTNLRENNLKIIFKYIYLLNI